LTTSPPAHRLLSILPEVQEALAKNSGVVALESTIISHGLPYPENLETARAIEATVRANGAIPATIAILDGVIKIGLSDADLEILAHPNSHVTKVSRRDIASVIAAGGHGATTVASTMIFAAMAGIPIFATGGIGGVHKGAETDFDISADLPELAQTNVAVISAGPKAILDLSLTMEYLETQGVPVIGYGTDELPAFWSRRSGIALNDSADTPEQIAAIMKTKWDLGLQGGLMIANPVPRDQEIPAQELADIITQALGDAHASAITGKAVTPFLLDTIRQKTDGKTLATNQALVMNNAKVAAQIACAYAAL
jgi:pseudouridine-5'-phosphate glycosidase